MKTQLKYIILLIMLSTYSCSNEQEQITNSSDYDNYIGLVDNKTLQAAINDRHFWEKKLEKDNEQFPYLVQLAASYSQLFSKTGKIEHLIKAEENLVKANEATDYSNTAYLRALARNYISQHRFKESLSLLEKAEVIGEGLRGTQKMLFDVHMELGQYEKAEQYLATIVDFSDFDYLIRTSKWHDHRGDLEGALKYMEQAIAIAESSKNKALMQWSYSNIADFYGHNGEIDKSYNHYLKALQIDSSDAYAKKGIAWIIYSYERNPEEALRILNSISSTYEAPDYLLFKAEIYEYMGDQDSKEKCRDQFLDAIDKTEYGVMYNMHKASVILGDMDMTENAISLAQQEVMQRPTPETYDMLAWSYYNNNNLPKALQIAKTHVEGKTFEPNALLHIAQIYKADGQKDKVEELKKELMESAYELGPLAEKQIIKL